jgi:hypothetical protein
VKKKKKGHIDGAGPLETRITKEPIHNSYKESNGMK